MDGILLIIIISLSSSLLISKCCPNPTCTNQ